MKIKAILIFLFVSYAIIAQNSDEYRIIPSVTDWIEEINNWPDTLYRQDKIKIHFDPKKDKDFIAIDDSSIMENNVDSIPRIVINKSIHISNVLFHNDLNQFNHVVLKNIHFKGEFKMYWLLNGRMSFKNCVFEKLHQVRLVKTLFYLSYFDCTFNGIYMQNNPAEPLSINFYRCVFNKLFLMTSDQGIPNVDVTNCSINESIIFGKSSKFNSIDIYNSKIKNTLAFSNVQIENAFELTKSEVGKLTFDGASLPIDNTYIPFEQISNKITLSEQYVEAYYANNDKDFEDIESYNRLIAMYAKLLSVYKSRSESESYNACYVEMRKKQTAYSKFLYTKDETFSNYTVYQLNVFMDVFSDYGTRPTKAILFSLYVILAFALIYLFFPNSWDKHGKNRIVDRYTFFMKYMNKNAGIHEVYLDDKKAELLEYDEFKKVIESSGKTVPKFFSATALPLYKWAVSGTKLSASLLKRVDIMKGSWSDLPEHKRIWKSILLVGAFLIALVYDVFIKILNALMLSINTFTTLGFGEIPIKGLPRYLAIIQGFIGWFMLTIFSVSLISQLLN
jgi:hypothetical protein